MLAVVAAVLIFLHRRVSQEWDRELGFGMRTVTFTSLDGLRLGWLRLGRGGERDSEYRPVLGTPEGPGGAQSGGGPG